ncbi:MAG: ABC transporter ATP-binding protein [Crenarchaeota archaeon]|nr:ABC transporter ATP-binding protein [Thermoproteota archaeon]
MDIALETKSLVKQFGGLRAVDEVSIKVPKKKIVLIIGPNGSGKTTLVNVISGVYKADGGKIFFLGKDITNKPPHIIYRLGLVRTFQIPQPLRKLTVLENVLLGQAYHPGENFVKALIYLTWLKREEELVEKAFKILEFLKLDHLWDQESYKLSGGQLKLLELGRALMADAKMMILDEPIAGVNPTLAHEIFRKIQEIRDRFDVTFLIIEHRLDIALKYVDYVYAMARGRVIAEGLPDEVVNNPAVIEAYIGG